MSSLPAGADHGDDEAPSNVIDISDDAKVSWDDLSDDDKLLQYTQDLSDLEESWLILGVRFHTSTTKVRAGQNQFMDLTTPSPIYRKERRS